MQIPEEQFSNLVTFNDAERTTKEAFLGLGRMYLSGHGFISGTDGLRCPTTRSMPLKSSPTSRQSTVLDPGGRHRSLERLGHFDFGVRHLVRALSMCPLYLGASG